MRQKNANWDRINGSPAIPHSASLRQVCSRSRSISIPYHPHRPSPILIGQSFITISIGRKFYITWRKCRDGGEGVISMVLTKTGATVWDREMMYKEVAQSLLLYGSESWVVIQWCLRSWMGFCRQAAIGITSITGKHVADREWQYPFGGGSTRISGLTPHTGLNWETVGDHCGTGGIPPHLWTLYRGRAEDRNESDDDPGGIRTWYINMRSRRRICVI